VRCILLWLHIAIALHATNNKSGSTGQDASHDRKLTPAAVMAPSGVMG
jgi:hypothetical protein